MTNEGCQLSAVSFQLLTDAGSFAVLEGALFWIQSDNLTNTQHLTPNTHKKTGRSVRFFYYNPKVDLTLST
jgi:hypothetical protein